MNLNYFKDKAEEKFGSIERFSEELGLSKIAVYKWLKSERIPEDRISQIADLLKFNEDELAEFLGVPKVEILLRKVGNTPSGDGIKAKFKSLANTFFKLDAGSYSVDESILSVVSGQSPIAIANYLRSLLGLEKNEPATLHKTIAQLKRHNINLFFFPLERAGYQLNSNQNREVAFTARKENRFIVFVDTRRTIDQINFDVLHELTHIVCRHQSREHNATEESLCNDVAQELVYPRALISQSALIQPFLNAKTSSWHKVIEIFQSFLSDFDWSPKGLGLALYKYELIQKPSHEFSRLMSLDKKLKFRTVDELFFEQFRPSDIDSLSSFFENNLQKDKEIYKPLIELKNAAAFNRLSSRRFAEIFNLDSGDADELVSSWRQHEEELEQAQATDEDSE